MADRVRFELTEGVIFKTVAFNRSAICPSENGEHYI